MQVRLAQVILVTGKDGGYSMSRLCDARIRGGAGKCHNARNEQDARSTSVYLLVAT